MDQDKKATDWLSIAIGLLLFCALAVAIIGLANKGKGLFNTGSQTLDTVIAGVNTSVYDIYLNTKQKGSDVIRIIDQSFTDDNLDVVVNTKDGAYLIYSKESLPEALTNSFDDSAYKDNLNKSGGAVPTLTDATTETENVNGYNRNVELGVNGYISQAATFDCLGVYDTNNDLRRLVFIQVD